MQIKGVPTIVVLKPKASGGKKERLDYNGERQTKAMTDFLVRAAAECRFAFGRTEPPTPVVGALQVKHMPEKVTRVTGASHTAFLAKNSDTPKLLVFTDKKTTPPLLKALSVKYKVRRALMWLFLFCGAHVVCVAAGPAGCGHCEQGR